MQCIIYRYECASNSEMLKKNPTPKQNKNKCTRPHTSSIRNICVCVHLLASLLRQMMIIFHLRLFVSAIPVRRVRITCNAYAHTPNSKQISAKNRLNWKRIRDIHNANWIRCRTWAKSNEYRNSKFYQNNNNSVRPANAVNELHRKRERKKNKFESTKLL